MEVVLEGSENGLFKWRRRREGKEVGHSAIERVLRGF